MLIFRNLFLTLISILILPVINAQNPTTYRTAVFPTDHSECVFHTSLNFMKYHFSGLMAVKRIRENEYHLAMLSEMGLTLLEMKYKDGAYQIIHILDEINRPFIIHRIQEDIQPLLKEIYYHSPGDQRIKIKNNAKYIYDIRSGKVAGIKRKKWLRTNAVYTLGNTSDPCISEISIIRKSIKNAYIHFKLLETGPSLDTENDGMNE